MRYKLGGGKNALPQAFITTVGGGRHRGVFIRIGGQRRSPTGWSKNLPIKELYGPSIGRVFGKFLAVGLARAEEALASNFEHEMAFARSGGDVSAAVPGDVDAGAE